MVHGENDERETRTGAAFHLSKLSEPEFKRLSGYIQSNFGIRMPETKRIMLESRLQRRLRVLGYRSFADYIEFLFGESGIRTELVHMIDAVTTNKTDFFREPDHFDYMRRCMLPYFTNSLGWGVERVLKVWSAGCSSGEEPYTLAMVLEEYRETCPRFSYRILGTDLSSRVLELARTAVYPEDRIAPVPDLIRRKYFLRSKNRESAVVRVVPHLRSRVSFGRMNLMDQEFGVDADFDIIFCRNVIIYFERDVQERLLGKLTRHLRPGGYLFLGHSETLTGMGLPLESAAPTIYRKQR